MKSFFRFTFPILIVLFLSCTREETPEQVEALSETIEQKNPDNMPFAGKITSITPNDLKAESLTTAHEDKPSSYAYSYKEKQMDLFNNRIGRSKHNWLSDGFNSLENSIINALHNGQLKYLSNLANNGRATQNSQLIPTH